MSNAASQNGTAFGAPGSLSITYAELMAEVGGFLGYGVDPAAWTAAQTAEIDRRVQSGVRQFYYPPAVQGVEIGYEWSFMRPTTTIATVDGDGEQDLPSDLARVVGDFHYAAGQYKRSIPIVSEAMVLAGRSRTSDESYPRLAAIRHKSQVAGAEQGLEVAWSPVPDTAYTLTYTYEAFSGKLSATNPYPLGGMKYAELLTESCLSVTEQKSSDRQRGVHSESFSRLLADAIARDRRQGARHYGPMSEGSDYPSRLHGAQENYPITYKDSTW